MKIRKSKGEVILTLLPDEAKLVRESAQFVVKQWEPLGDLASKMRVGVLKRLSQALKEVENE